MVNSMILQGRLTADIQLRHTQSDVAYSEFTVAWSDKYKDTETKCFLRCKAWRRTAEFLDRYFRKGQEIAIQGRMVTEQWEADGEKESRTICLVDKVNFCGSKTSGGGSGGGKGPDSQASGAPDPYSDGFMDVPDGIDDELPFH